MSRVSIFSFFGIEGSLRKLLNCSLLAAVFQTCEEGPQPDLRVEQLDAQSCSLPKAYSELRIQPYLYQVVVDLVESLCLITGNIERCSILASHAVYLCRELRTAQAIASPLRGGSVRALRLC